MPRSRWTGLRLGQRKERATGGARNGARRSAADQDVTDTLHADRADTLGDVRGERVTFSRRAARFGGKSADEVLGTSTEASTTLGCKGKETEALSRCLRQPLRILVGSAAGSSVSRRRGCARADIFHSYHGGADIHNDIEESVRATEGEVWAVVGVKHDVRRFMFDIDAGEFGSCHELANNTVVPPDPQSRTMVTAQGVVAKDVDARKV